MFEPSSADKKSESKCISIWVEALTVADQAWAMMGAKPANTVVACFRADAVAAVPAQPGFAPMRTVWETAVVDNGDDTTSPNNHPGADGHAGLWGLLQGGGGNADKAKRLALRSALADLAEISPVPVPHDLAEEHIRIAAYFLTENHGGTRLAPEAYWMRAVRHLRRERVQKERDDSD